MQTNIKDIRRDIESRLLLLDGAMGTMIQRLRLTADDYHGNLLKGHPTALAGNNDILVLTRPDDIKRIHLEYLRAGADIISTDTFNANAISQADYGTQRLVRRMNLEAARIAREAIEETIAHTISLTGEFPKKYVAGSMGPTNKTASISPDIADPAKRDITFGQLKEAYSEQAQALIEGGVDILLFETVFDTLNLKAGLAGAREAMELMGREVPVMVSATVSDRAGRLLGGQTVEAFVNSILPWKDFIVSIGLNCSFGPVEIGQYLRQLAKVSPLPVSCHPNAGLPDAMGEYKETPEMFASVMSRYAEEGLLNIAGGCCGTTPEHIRALAPLREKCRRPLAEVSDAKLRLSGLEPLDIGVAGEKWIMVGERCNVAGSRRFLRLIKEGNFDEALDIARSQVAAGAKMLDVNMDDAMLDAPNEMRTFLNLLASDPDAAKAPVMIDSSDWHVVTAALECLQGKGIVNSISLKEGEEEFLRKARHIKSMGAAMVVMSFDEKGQADTYERKIAICGRAYELLTRKAGIEPSDIVFDPNIMAVATGIEAHDRYGIDYLKAVKWIKENLPGAKTSGGVSNLSFAFRGNNSLREAIHAVFLHHASKMGLDMAIVNPSAKFTFDDLPQEAVDAIEDVILCRDVTSGEKVEKLLGLAMQREEETTKVKKDPEEGKPIEERLAARIVAADWKRLQPELDEALDRGMKASALIQGPLMEGMKRVGDLFGKGKMFLPQVVKTARTMNQAVSHLRPAMESETDKGGKPLGKVLFATVKGDVHDIGKNIVSIVLGCNNWEVTDLGVMVPAEKIVEAAKAERPDMICLSGLITPSLGEMVKTAEALKDAGLGDIPLVVGGATTSPEHTAMKIAPVYSPGIVAHASDAARNPVIAARLLADKEGFAMELNAKYADILKSREVPRRLSMEDARKLRHREDWSKYTFGHPYHNFEMPFRRMRFGYVKERFDWKMLLHAWKMIGPDGTARKEESERLLADARAMLQKIEERVEHPVMTAWGWFPAYSEDETIYVEATRFKWVPLEMSRQTIPNDRGECLSLADYVPTKQELEENSYATFYVGVFVVTAGLWADEMAKEYRDKGDEYSALLVQSLADRLAEAGSAYHGVGLTGIRPAVGYPSWPDQRQMHQLAKILPSAFENGPLKVTENGAIKPSSTVAGLWITTPDARYFTIR